jgi:type IV secretory pathway VirB4 component
LGNGLISGASGFGKTTTMMVILYFLVSWFGTQVLLISRHREYHNLFPEFHVFRPELGIYFNPILPPPGHRNADGLFQWAGITAEIFAVVLALQIPTKQYFLECLRELYRQWNPVRTGDWPSLADLIEYIRTRRNAPGTNDVKLKSAILNRLEGINHQIFHCSEGNLQLINKPGVLETDGLSIEQESLLVVALIFWKFYDRMHRLPPNSMLDEVLAIDEAQVLLFRQPGGPLPVMSQIFASVRKMGLAILAAVQSPSLVEPAVIQNTATKIIFRLNAGQDLREMGAALRFSSRQLDEISKLERGRAILTAPGYANPVLVRCYPFLKGRP